MRFKALGALLVIALGIMAFGNVRSVAHAQDTDMASHPLVGAWKADTDTDDPTNASSIFLFNADGTYSEVDGDGSVAMGAWEATGEDAATLTAFNFPGDGQGGNFGTITIRATITMGADDNSFTADYTLEFTDPVGNSTGEAGPGHASGTRVKVTGPGTPAMSIADMFAMIQANSQPPAESTTEPTVEATGAATMEPTTEPSAEPTESGTTEPTTEPTVEATGTESGGETPEATSTP